MAKILAILMTVINLWFHKPMLSITSPDFIDGGLIPTKYSCRGENVHPPLVIAGVPTGTVSLALIVDDPDAPSGDFHHWLLWNIPPDIVEISTNAIPVGAEEGTNDAGKIGYIGPCPPSGIHRYYFKLYALNSELGLNTGAKNSSLELELTSHIIGQAQLMGRYGQ